MVGKSGEKGKGERKKVLEMMSLQFNSSDIPDHGSDDSKRGRRSSRVGRPPKKMLQNMEYSIKSSQSIAADVEQPSLASVNPTTHSLKKIRKDKPEEISFGQGEYDDLQKSESERESGEENSEFPDNVFDINNSDLAVTAGRKRRGRISQSSHVLSSEGSVNVRGMKGMRRGRGRSRGRADSLSPAIGRESPRSESSLDSFQSRQRRNPKHSLLEEFPSDLELHQDIVPRGRGRGRGRSSVFLNSSRGRGRARGNQDPGSRRSATPVIGELEEMPNEEIKVKRSAGRPKKVDDPVATLTPTTSLSVDSPAGSIGGQSTSSNKANSSKKKKRKHFKGLKYSFVKKKKKPKAKPPNMSVDANPETESIASEDVDGDSFDSSSQVGQ